MIDIRPVSRDNLDEVSRMHMRLFAEDYSTSLGYRFVKEYYYGLLMEDKAGFGFMAYDGVTPVGFIFGAYDSERVEGARFLPKLLHTFIGFIAHPVKNLRWLGLFFVHGRRFKSPFKAELVSLAVKEEFQGRGIAKMLVSVFKRHLRDEGARGCWTKTYSPAAARVYASEGFNEAGGFDFMKRRYRFYVWEGKDG